MNLSDLKVELKNRIEEDAKEFMQDKTFIELVKELNLNTENKNTLTTDVEITKNRPDTLKLDFELIYDIGVPLEDVIEQYSNTNIDCKDICKEFVLRFLGQKLKQLNQSLVDLGLNKVIIKVRFKYPFQTSRQCYYTAYDTQSVSIDDTNLNLGDLKRIIIEDFPKLVQRFNLDSRYNDLTHVLNLTLQNNNEPYRLSNSISLDPEKLSIKVYKTKPNVLELVTYLNNYPERYKGRKVLYKKKDYKDLTVDCDLVANIFLRDYLVPYLQQFSRTLLRNDLTRVNIISHYAYPFSSIGEGNLELRLY